MEMICDFLFAAVVSAVTFVVLFGIVAYITPEEELKANEEFMKQFKYKRKGRT